MDINFSVLGHEISVSPHLDEKTTNTENGKHMIGKKEVSDALETLKKYKDAKLSLERRIVENERWYRLRHWDVIDGGKDDDMRAKPTSAWLLNCLMSKHADAMDNYPEPNILPRERGDVKDAKILGSIIPVVLERNDFEETYSDAWWYKLKSGTACYGVFWNNSMDNGLGDIDIKKIDILNVFWEPGISKIQASANIFIVDLISDEVLLSRYPKLKGKLQNKAIDVQKYVLDDSIDTSDKSLVIDWYYKKCDRNGRTLLHYVKFVGDTVLFASENDEDYKERGFYDHGKYPIVLDVLFPEESTPTGFGFVDMCKDPQMYIDKLNQIVIENAIMSGKPRFFIKDTGGINEKEFADWSNNFVHVAGNLNEDNIRQIEVKPLDGYIIDHLQFKIAEIKETSGNRDFSAGGTNSGVTAASAIAALQEAGNKTSRDMVRGAYRAFSAINCLCIELIRQFYDETRTFRIIGENNGVEFIEYSNENLQDQEIADEYDNEKTKYRRPIFDINVKAQKTNPYSRMEKNQLAKELYSAGFFDPQRCDMAVIALDMMDFEGKAQTTEKVLESKKRIDTIQEQQGQIEQMKGQLASMSGGGVRQMEQAEERQRWGLGRTSREAPPTNG